MRLAPVEILAGGECFFLPGLSGVDLGPASAVSGSFNCYNDPRMACRGYDDGR